jgi:hypothetical protein
MKSMQDNSNLLRLKLDMVYRDLAMEVAQQAFMQLTTPTAPTELLEAPLAPMAAEPPKAPAKSKRKKLITTK